MFRLRDATRRRIGVAGFFVLGAAPALVIGVWCAARHAPNQAQTAATELGRRLGLNVTVGDLQYPRPGVVRYHRVEAADPETGRSLFRCRRLEIAEGRRRDARGQWRDTRTVTLLQPELQASALEPIGRRLRSAMDGSTGSLDVDVRWSAAELTLRADSESQTFCDVAGTLETLPGGVQMQMDFHLAGAKAPEPARIRIVRNRQVSPPASGFELYTGGGPLPCSVLGLALAELKTLGPRCQFSGGVWANEMAGGWQGEVTGRLLDLDVGRLVSDYFPDRLTGVGEAAIQTARFRGGRLEAGRITVSAGPGAIDRSLIRAVVDRLGLVSEGTLSEQTQASYQQLAFSATLDAQGFRISGRCAGAEPGVVLCNHQGKLLSEPVRQPAPAAALARALAPQNVVQVPVVRQTDWLLRHLPVPDATTPPEAESAEPRAQVRRSDEWRR
ncbi:MAG: hypothetical protein ABFC54_05960 [Thermoguttaceae bacterium]